MHSNKFAQHCKIIEFDENNKKHSDEIKTKKTEKINLYHELIANSYVNSILTRWNSSFSYQRNNYVGSIHYLALK